MPIPNAADLDWARPHTAKLRGVANVLEERGLWLTGHMVTDPEVRFELSFELSHTLKCLPKTFVTTLGMWDRSRCIFEFCMSTLQFKPDALSYALFVAPLIERLDDYYPLHDNAQRFRDMRARQLAR